MKKIVWTAASFSLLLLGACAQSPVKQFERVFYPPLPQTPRMQFLTSISSEDDVSSAKQSQFRRFVVGDAAPSIKRIGRAQAVAHGPGKIFVVDKVAGTVIIIELESGLFDYIKDIKGGPLKNPVSLFVAADGYLYVADAARREIVVYNDRGEFFTTYAFSDDAATPTDVVIHGDRMYVCNLTGHEVIVLDKASGEIIQKIGGIGQEEGLFNKPTHLAIDAQGNLFVVDSFNFRIQMFDRSGAYLKTFGYYEVGPGGLTRPKGIDVDKSGHVYSVDAAFELVQIYDVDTTDPLLFFGKYGPAPGSTYLPSDAHVDYDNVQYFSKYADPQFEVEYLVYVGNQLGANKVNVYGFGNWKGKSSDSSAQPVRERIEVKQSIPGLEEIVAPPDSGTKKTPPGETG